MASPSSNPASASRNLVTLSVLFTLAAAIGLPAGAHAAPSLQNKAIMVKPSGTIELFSQQAYSCSSNGITRRVELVFAEGDQLPCSVNYYKDEEAPGERQVLWSADHLVGFCEEKTEKFVQKLRGWGWQCQRDEDRLATLSSP